MDVHEYQAKALLKRYGVSVPPGGVAGSAAEARDIAAQLPGPDRVVKAQILAGGRAAAGGVKIVHDIDDIAPLAELFLGAQLTTAQTGAEGQTIRKVYIEQACSIKQAFYLALMIDTELAQPVFIASPESGKGSIEAAARKHPDMVLRLPLHPTSAPDSASLKDFISRTGLSDEATDNASEQLQAMYTLFTELEATLIEIGPMALLEDDQIVALDAKMSFDDNALFRQPEIRKLRDDCHLSAAQQAAALQGLNYQKLGGNIGILASGAGLAMATLDAINENNSHDTTAGVFLDVPPTASVEQVAAAFSLLLQDDALNCILVNVFGGGIMRCDVIADGLIAALDDKAQHTPLVVRLNGVNASLGYDKLHACANVSGLNAASLSEAATAAAEIAQQTSATSATSATSKNDKAWIAPVKRFFSTRSR